MDIREHMDALLANVTDQGHVPERFIVREEDWRELVNRYNLYPDTETEGPARYNDVPVEFGQVSDQMIAALYNTAGGVLLQEGR